METLLGHLVGDFLLQNDWMAQGKKKHPLPAVVHCLLYTAAIWLFTGWGLAWLAVVFVTHLYIDTTNVVPVFMGWIGQTQFRDRMGPWSVIIVDNTYHLLILYAIPLVVGCEGVAAWLPEM